MNKLCDLCINQQSDGRGGLACGIARYKESPDGYKSFQFKNGAVCIYDSDLNDYFKAGKNETEFKNMSCRIFNQNTEIEKLKYEISVLKDRLTSLDLD